MINYESYAGVLSSSVKAPCAEAAYRDLLLSLVDSETVWLDLGCGRFLVREWLPDAQQSQLHLSQTCKRIVGIDLEEDDVRLNPYIHEAWVGSIERLPFPNNSFSLITAQMVVEHLSNPLRVMRECMRVLAPGGTFIALTPNLKNLLVAAASLIPDAAKRPLTQRAQSRSAHDIFQTHYRMNTPAAFKKMLGLVGMQVEFIEHIDGSPDLKFVPVLNKIEEWIRSVQPEALRSDLLVLAAKPLAA